MRRGLAIVLASLVVSTGLWLHPGLASAGEEIRRFALVVGSNRPPRAGLAVLRYADDDAIRWAGLFATFGAEVEVLTSLDAETTRLVGAEAPPHHAATQPELRAAMARLVDSMRRAHDQGRRTAFFFVYAGHGDVDRGEGLITLADGPFWRSDLERQVLALSTADTNHVIVDACRSAYLAYDRGPGGERRPWTAPYFGASAVARFRNTGFLLASSADGASHEWEEFQAGIFSHELRSGLLGGADADGDGRITYRELAAFVRVANQSVRNEKFRPTMLAIAPRQGDDVVVDLAAARAGRVHIGAGRSAHRFLEDGLGVRWADVHPSDRLDVTLALPATATPRLFLRAVDAETEYALGRDAVVELAKLTTAPSKVTRRGALSEAFASLFARPFDAAALKAPELEPQAELSLLAPPPSPPRQRHKPLEISLAVASLASFGVSAYLLASAQSIRDSSAASTGTDRQAVNDAIDSRNRWSAATAITGGLLAVAAGALVLWDHRGTDREASP